jgi:hypothetical protein
MARGMQLCKVPEVAMTENAQGTERKLAGNILESRE